MLKFSNKLLSELNKVNPQSTTNGRECHLKASIIKTYQKFIGLVWVVRTKSNASNRNCEEKHLRSLTVHTECFSSLNALCFLRFIA